jgi:transaldolase
MDHLQAELRLDSPMNASALKVKVFADGADLDGIRRLYADQMIAGFTTNPTLLRKAGISDYETFAHQLLEAVPDRPLSFEVFSDEPTEMERQARLIATWGEHVYVKAPITFTSGEPTGKLTKHLCHAGVKVNVTGLTTLLQVEQAAEWVSDGPPSYISVFAGRVADIGVDPVPVVELLASAALNSKLIWASPREILNVVQADQIGCHIITVTHDLLQQLSQLGKDLSEYSLETVRMFCDDAAAAGFTL